MVTVNAEAKSYQVDRTGSGLIIHNYDGNASFAPKPGEPALTWAEAHAILLAATTETLRSQGYSYAFSPPEDNPVSFADE